MGERCNRTAEASGSIPLSSTSVPNCPLENRVRWRCRAGTTASVRTSPQPAAAVSDRLGRRSRAIAFWTGCEPWPRDPHHGRGETCRPGAVHPLCLAPFVPCTLGAWHPWCLAPLVPCTLGALHPWCLAPLVPCTLGALHPWCHSSSEILAGQCQARRPSACARSGASRPSARLLRSGTRLMRACAKECVRSGHGAGRC